MSAPEIAKELTIAAIAKTDPGAIAGGIGVGEAEALGKKFGQLYRGILIEVVDEIRMTDEDWTRLRQELEEWEREQKEE